MRVFTLIAGLALVGAQSGVAQAPSDAAMRAAAVLRTPALSSAADRATPTGNVLAPREFSSRAPGATLMIVGGASLLAGIFVGGDGGLVLILAGIGVGAYGLYLYTR